MKDSMRIYDTAVVENPRDDDLAKLRRGPMEVTYRRLKRIVVRSGVLACQSVVALRRVEKKTRA